MRPRILVISTYADLTSKCWEISKELNIDISVREGGIMRDGHLYAKKMEANFDVIISHGGTTNAIQALVKTIPVLQINLTSSALLKALSTAAQYEKPIALISNCSDSLANLQDIANVLNVEYKVFTYSNKAEFKQQTEQILSMAEHTLVGTGSCIEAIAKQKNFNYIVIKSTEKAIRQALISAKSIIDLSSKEKLYAEKLKSIINYSNAGILSVDKNGVITIINSPAEKILRITDKAVLYKNINDRCVPNSLRLLYDSGAFHINELIKINDTAFLVNRIPLQVDSEQEETVITFWEVSNIQKLESKARMQLHDKGLVAKNTFQDIISVSKNMKDMMEKAVTFSNTSATILIQGDTGTGKELLAQSVHNASPRNNEPFVAINCATLPENLLESELFGYEEGAFTGAKKGGKPGLFELAHNGSIFLDEIGEIPLSVQSRLLRVLQEKEIMRIGGDRISKVNVRVIAATNRNLYKLVKEGSFREDLYFRISILNLILPPLRQRKEDVPVLVNRFIHNANKKYNTDIQTISPQSIQLLQGYSWPGNIRELEFFVEKLALLANKPILNLDFVELIFNEHISGQEQIEMADNAQTLTVNIETLKNMELQIIEKMLKRHSGNKKQVAKMLGISRATVWNKLGSHPMVDASE